MRLDNIQIITPGTVSTGKGDLPEGAVIVNSGMYQSDEDFINNEITVFVDWVMPVTVKETALLDDTK